MNLSETEVKQYYRLYHALLFYINDKYSVLEGIERPGDLHKMNLDDIQKLKDILYGKLELIDSFIEDNHNDLSAQDREIVSSWKNFVSSRFYIVRHLKRYTIFLDTNEPPKAYGVLGIITPLEDLIGTDLPRVVKATLLPFENRIIYDGTILPFNIQFGSGIRRSINDSYSQAKNSIGIITSLPFSREKTEISDANTLRGYLKTGYSRDAYQEEIWELIEKNSELMAVYCEEMGKVHARTYKKRLKDAGIVDGWFALIDGMIIAGGKTQQEVERILRHLLPPEKIKLVYVFHLKAK